MTNDLHFVRRGQGPKLLLVHGLGGSWRSWSPVLEELAAKREVIAVDLPGFGNSPALKGPTTIASLCDALTAFLKSHHLTGIDAVGSSMGARIVLELARRGGILGSVVALSPGGFWRGWERHFFYVSIYLSIRVIRLVSSLLRALTRNPLSRSVLFAQFSIRPWKLSPVLALDELRSYEASLVFDELLFDLAYGESQRGSALNSIRHHLVVGWGRQDLVCFARQAERCVHLFPDADLHWFEHCGHFPHWDKPSHAARLILASTDEIEENLMEQLHIPHFISQNPNEPKINLEC